MSVDEPPGGGDCRGTRVLLQQVGLAGALVLLA